MAVRGLKVGQRVRFTDEARYTNSLCGPGRTFEYGTIISKDRFRSFRSYGPYAGKVRLGILPDHDHRRFYMPLSCVEPADNKFDLIIAKKFPDVDAAIAAATTIAAKIKLPISVRAT